MIRLMTDFLRNMHRSAQREYRSVSEWNTKRPRGVLHIPSREAGQLLRGRSDDWQRIVANGREARRLRCIQEDRRGIDFKGFCDVRWAVLTNLTLDAKVEGK